MTIAAQAGLLVLCDVFVSGHAKTKGSLEHIGGGQLRDKPSSYKWRKLVAERVKSDLTKRHGVAWGEEAYNQRVGVRIISYGRPPEKGSWLQRAKNWLIAKAGFGDVDKFARNVLDALSCEREDDAHLIADDSLVVDLYSHKRLALPGMMFGQQITVWAIPEDAPW
jgi:hypothetical protein